MKIFKLIFLLLCVSMQAMADYEEGYFVYEDNTKTTITGLTEAGRAATALTIPASVNSVGAYAFQDNEFVSELVIDGNVAFDINAFSAQDEYAHVVKNQLTTIDAGSNMSVTNLERMLRALVGGNSLESIYIEGYTDAPEGDIQWTFEADPLIYSVLTSAVKVTLPAVLVGNQTFGNAKVYGRFEINTASGIATTCVNKTFRDTDTGSNLLFYAATGVPYNTQNNIYEIKVERVYYIKAGEGLLMHNADGTSWWAELERYDGNLPDNESDKHNNNMLKGTLASTPLSPTVEINSVSYSNLVLSQGAFHPITGGSLGANRAYLQIETETLNAILGTSSSGKLSIAFPEEGEETTSINILDSRLTTLDQAQPMYNLSGQKVSDSYKGIVIVNGKKILKR